MNHQRMVEQLTAQQAECTQRLQTPFDSPAVWRQAPPPSEARRLGRPIRALIIGPDDTAERLESLLEQVEESLFEIARVGDTEEARSALSSRPLDVILLTIVPGGPDPLVSLGDLQEAAPMAAHILVGDVRHERSGLAAIRHGAQDYLVLEKTDAPLAKRIIRFAMERKAVHNGLQAKHHSLQRSVDEQISRCRAIVEKLDHESLSRQRVETRLRNEHELNQAILRHAGTLILVLDGEGRIIQFNPECEKIIGAAAADAEGHALTDVLPNLTPAGLESLYEELRMRGGPIVNREQWHAADGRARVIEWTNTWAGGDGSDCSMLVRIGADVTAREEMQAALRESERRLRLVTDALPALIAYIDGDGCYRFANKAHSEWLGIDAERVCGMHFADVWPEGARSVLSPYVQHVSSECTLQEFDATLRGLPGQRERDVTVSLVPDRSTPGKAAGFYALFHDVTEYRQARRREHERLRELAHVTRINSLDGMSGQIIHELRQPLAAISAYGAASLRLLPDRGVEAKELRDTLIALSQQTGRAGEIVQRLCRLARNAATTRGEVELNRLVEDVLRLVRSEADLSAIDISLDLDEGLPPIQADPVLLEQVLINLIRNALDALAEVPKTNRCITIETRLGENGALSLRVSDTGPGLRPQVAERMFDPFYSTKADGMGMGLSISRTIMQAHHGRLWAESCKRGGARLCMELPIRGPR